jgi:hypothetical protein
MRGAGVRERDVHGENGQWGWWSGVLRRVGMTVGVVAGVDFGVGGSVIRDREGERDLD